MNYDDFDADQFVEFEASMSSEFDGDFSTLYSSLENLICSPEKKMSRTVTVTSEYIPSSVESSFELGEEYSTHFCDDPGNPNVRTTAFSPEILACSTQKKPSRPVTPTFEYLLSSLETSCEPGEEENLIDFSDEPANAKAGKTPLDYLEKALSEFVQFQTDPQTSSESLSKEVDKTCSENTRHNSPMNLPRDFTYRIFSAVTPSSHYGSPLSETRNVLSSSEEYESCLNRTGQESLIGAMESLQIKSVQKIGRNCEELEDFYGNSEIALIVTPYEISEGSNFGDKNCEDEQNAVPTETSLRSKSDMENLSSSANISGNQIIGRTYMIGEEIAETVPSYGIPEASDFRDKNCEAEQNALPTKTSLRSKSDMENLSSSANISENRATGRTYMIGEEIAETVPSYEIPEASDSRDKNCEAEQKVLPTETSLRSVWDIENLLFLAHIAENQTTGRTYALGEEDNSEIATTIHPYGIPEASGFRDRNAEDKQSAIPSEANKKTASSSANIAETRTTGRTFTCGKEDKSEIVETVPPYGILDKSSSIEDIEETPRVLPDEDCAPPKSVQPDAVAEQKKKRKNARVLTSQVRRQSLKYRRSSGQFVSMAEAMLKFQKGTPKRFRSTVKKNQNRPAQPKIKSLQRVTCPVSPALRCKSRARPSKLPIQEEREMLEIEESRRNRFKATKSPAPQKSTAPSEKSAASSSKNSNLLSAGELKTLPRRATPRRKTLVKSVVSTEDGPELVDVEIFNNGVPIQRTKSPLTKPEPFSFEKRDEKILEKREEPGSAMMEDEKRKTIHPRSSAATSTVTSGSLEGTARKPIDLTFRERNELLLAKKKLTAVRAREEKQAWVFHARLAPPVKHVMVRGASTENLGPARLAPTSKPAKGTSTENLGPARLAPTSKPARGTSTENLGPARLAPTSKPARGTSTENLGPAKVARMLKPVPRRGTSTENLGPANAVPTLIQEPGRGTSTENLGPANVAPSVKQVPERGTLTENLDPAKIAPMMQAGPGRTTPTENLCPTKVAPRTKQVPGPMTSTENLGLEENKQKTRGLSATGRSRGLSPAERSRGLSPAERSRGLSPAGRSRGLSPAGRSRGLSPSIADREIRDPNVSSMSNQCPKLKAPLSLYTEDRSKKRQEFDATRRRKEEEAEEHRREYEAYRLAQEKREERELRRTMESRARPMPVFKEPKIVKSLKPLTDPQSPAWSRKKSKK